MNKHTFIDKALKSQRQPDLSEYDIHCQIASYLNMVIKRPSRWHTVEVSNQQSGKAGMFKQISLKKKGVVTGWPDIEIIWVHEKKGIIFKDNNKSCKIPIATEVTELIFLEVKTETGTLTDRQQLLHAELREDGHLVYVVRDITDVEIIFKQLGVI